MGIVRKYAAEPGRSWAARCGYPSKKQLLRERCATHNILSHGADVHRKSAHFLYDPLALLRWLWAAQRTCLAFAFASTAHLRQPRTKASNTDFASSSSAPVLQLAHPFSSAMVSTQGQDTDLDLLAAARRPRAAFQQFVSRPYSQWSGPVFPISSDARSQLATQLGGNDAWGPESPMLSPIGIQARCRWRWLPLSHRIGGSHGFFEENP